LCHSACSLIELERTRSALVPTTYSAHKWPGNASKRPGPAGRLGRRRRRSQLLRWSHRCYVTSRNSQRSGPTANTKVAARSATAEKRSVGLPSQTRPRRTWWRKRRLRRRHEGSCLSEDSLFDLCGCSPCFGDRVFGGAFPLTGRRAVLAAASASKRISALRSVTVVLLIDQSCVQQVPRVVVVVSFAHPRSEHS
jgi:hypothetical protein